MNLVPALVLIPRLCTAYRISKLDLGKMATVPAGWEGPPVEKINHVDGFCAIGDKPACMCHMEDAVAEKDLAVTRPTRLGLALHYSIFQYEVLQQPDEACKIVRPALEYAIAELKNVAEDVYKYPTLLMQLRDSLIHWTPDQAVGSSCSC